MCYVIVAVIILIVILLIVNTKDNYSPHNPYPRYNRGPFIPIVFTVPLQLPNLIGIWEVLQNGAFAGYIKIERISGDEFQGYHYNYTMQESGDPSFKFRVIDYTNILVMNTDSGNFTANVTRREPLTFGGMSYVFRLALTS